MSDRKTPADLLGRIRSSPVAGVAGALALVAVVAVLAALLGDDAPSGASADSVMSATAGTTAGVTTTPAAASPADATIYLSDDATGAQIAALRSRLDALVADGTVRDFALVSAEDALADLRSRLDDPTILDDLPSNPLPASFRVQLSDPAFGAALGDAVKALPGIDPQLGVAFGGWIPVPAVTTP